MEEPYQKVTKVKREFKKKREIILVNWWKAGAFKIHLV
jgi:hypothetical protein